MGFHHHFGLEKTKLRVFLGQDTRMVFTGGLAQSAKAELGRTRPVRAPCSPLAGEEGAAIYPRFLGQSALRRWLCVINEQQSFALKCPRLHTLYDHPKSWPSFHPISRLHSSTSRWALPPFPTLGPNSLCCVTRSILEGRGPRLHPLTADCCELGKTHGKAWGGEGAAS